MTTNAIYLNENGRPMDAFDALDLTFKTRCVKWGACIWGVFAIAALFAG